MVLNNNISCLNCDVNCIQQYNIKTSIEFIEKANSCKDYKDNNDGVRRF